MYRSIVIAALLFGFSHITLSQNRPFPCRDDDNACVIGALRNHETRQASFWEQVLAKPATERIDLAPAALMEYVTLSNIKEGIADRPRPATPTPEFVSELRSALSEMPASVKKLFATKLAGIYFLDGFGGSGFAEQIYRDEKPVGAYIVLDASVLAMHTANAWATWKENTPFKPSPDFTLTATIETAAHDNRKQAIQYLLLHELAHVIAVDSNLHPDWNISAENVDPDSKFPFYDLSWRVDKDAKRHITRYDDIFPRRKDVVYYFGAKLDASDIIPIYETLALTSFPTLYASTNPYDDFAEAFVSYVHTVIMKKPFEIRLRRDGKTVKIYKSCWSEKRCAQKRRLLEQLLQHG